MPVNQEFETDLIEDSEELVLHKLLPSSITECEAWKDFAYAVEKILSTVNISADGVSKEGAWLGIEKIKNFRNPSTIHIEFLSLLASVLGFNQEHGKFIDITFRSIVKELCRYYERSGTAILGQFMGAVAQTKGKIEPLWANIKDPYGSYFRNRVPRGQQSIYEGGHWYLTPHVNYLYTVNEDIFYEQPSNPTEDEKYRASLYVGDPELIRKLFYDLAPVHLVLEKIIGQLSGVHDAKITGCWTVRNCYPDELYVDSFQITGGWKFRILETSSEIL